jgi:hypothetical protein
MRNSQVALHLTLEAAVSVPFAALRRGTSSTARSGRLRRSLWGFAAAIMSWVGLCSVAVGARDVNLAAWTVPEQGFEMQGAAEFDQLGYSVADAGDVNGDGYRDILVGAPSASIVLNSTRCGAVYLVFGSGSRSTTTIDAASAISPKGVKIFGAAGDDLLGWAVSGVGDVNEDGIDDFIVGSDGFDLPTKIDAGGAVVVFGKTSGWEDINLASFTSGSAGFWIYGAAVRDHCGRAVNVAGDVNGDGTNDLIVGCAWASPLSRSAAGTSYVIFGHRAVTAPGTVDLSAFSAGSAGFRIFGATPGDGSGDSTSGAGDINGDGYGDILVDALGFDGPSGRTDCGAVYVIFGHSPSTAFTDIDLAAFSSSQGFRVTGAATDSSLGWSVSSAGDFNHDGYGDISVGSGGSNLYIFYGHSTIIPFSDVDLATYEPGSAGFIITGDFERPRSGGGADLNGDGNHDLVVATPNVDVAGVGYFVGIVYVLYGRPSVPFSYVNLSQGLSSVSGFHIIGAAELDSTGGAVALVHDYDGDGISDVLVGATGSAPFGRAYAGTVRLIYGEKSAPTSQPTSQPSRQPSARPTSSPVSERSGDVDLATWTKPGQGLEMWGGAAGDLLGHSVTDAGDVNGDGFHDILVGAYLADVGGKLDAGAVFLVFGSPSRSTSVIDAADAMQPKGVKIAGAVGGDNWGIATSGAGDFNKDGIDDFIIGGYGHDPLSRADAGAVVVIFGKTSGWADIDLVSFASGSSGFWIYGAVASDRCGRSIGAVGDVNGDGVDDLVVGAYAADVQSKADAGTSYVIFGHSVATAFGTIDLLTLYAGIVGFKILGATAGDLSGYSSSGAGDVNGDGYGDVLVGALYYDGPGGSNSGAAYLIFGHSNATAFTDIDLATLSSSQGFRITGAAASANFGGTVSSARDFNDDGYDDIMVGSAASKAYVFYGHSTATPFSNVDLVSFALGTAGFIVAGDSVGLGCSGGVDVNGDGALDLVFGAPSGDVASTGTDVGIVYVLYGRPPVPFTYVNLSQGLSSVAGFRIIGLAAYDGTGTSVALVRDFDGDGVGDIVVGATGSDPSGRASAGTARLIYGELSAPTSQPSRQPSARPTSSPVSERSGDVDLAAWTKPREGLEVWGAAANNELGGRVAEAGDVNRDGFHDILIGASGAAVSGTQYAGVVYLIFGSPSRMTSTIDTASTLALKGVKISGVGPYSYWGTSVSAAGDFNKDGVDDFVIGAKGYALPARTDAGAAVVIFGKTSGWADIDLASFTSGSAGFWIYGAADGSLCGRSVSGAGDVNGDGASDVIVGCESAAPQSKVNAGTSYVIFGHSTATSFDTIDLLSVSSSGVGFKIAGATAGDMSGYCVSGAGDINGDGYGDVLVGAPNYDCPGASDCGAAYVIFGHSAATSFTDIDLAFLSSSQGFRATGAAMNDRVGGFVNTVGDFNQDGYGDITVGSTANMVFVSYGHSATTPFANIDLASFVSGSGGFLVTGDSLGSTCSGGVDINGDGIHDLVLGAPNADVVGVASDVGTVHVLYGRPAVPFSNVDLSLGLSSASGFRITGASASDRAGLVGVVRDFDGDGVGDLVIGAPGADHSGRLDAGTAYLLYGELSSPTSQPSKQPTSQPSRQPTAQPSRQPTVHPTSQPNAAPTAQPSKQPTCAPTAQPSSQPSRQPSRHPTARPSGQPSRQPAALPSSQPSIQPTNQPSHCPTVQPSAQPSRQPTSQPSSTPSSQSSLQPSAQPSVQPTRQPSTAPSGQPSLPPSSQPTRQPVGSPTSTPTGQPSGMPSAQPFEQPSVQPSCTPSCQPAADPSSQPTQQPTGRPSNRPTCQPSTLPTVQPSRQPSTLPSVQPTRNPTVQPSSIPSSQPTSVPSSQPTRQPTGGPSSIPTVLPTQQPVDVPSAQPSRQPSAKPSNVPSTQPTSQPSLQPSCQPSSVPSVQPFSQPSSQPSQRPTMQPSYSPSAQSSRQPTAQPSCTPSGQPTVQPSNQPSRQPTTQPTGAPSRQPSAQPSCMPTHQPTGAPTAKPSTQPSGAPSLQPTSQPTGTPTRQPTNQPTSAPTAQPSGRPSTQPSRQPTCRPSTQPTSAPSRVVVVPATLGCSVAVEYVGRTVGVVKATLHGARDGYLRLYAVMKVGGSSQSADATAVALQQESAYIAHITGQKSAALNVTGLLPFTEYDLYCVATSSQGITMQLPSILTTKQSLRTTCCKTITVAVLHPTTISLGQQIARAVRVTTDAPPSASLSVTVGYVQSAGVQLLPAVLRYDNRSAISAKDVQLTALRAGNYTLVVGLTGSSALEYSVVYIGAKRLTVLAADATPAVPQLLQAAFSNDGSYLTLSFDAATDRGGLYGTFHCRTLLRFVGGNNANCQWFSDNQLRIYPVAVGASATVRVGGNVTLLENTVRARCTDTQRAAGQCASNLPVAPATVIVIAPSAPITPFVVISAPSAIGGCNSLTLDLAGSVGAAGRAWDTVSFAVSTTPTSTNAAGGLLQFLTRNYTLSPPLPVPSAVLVRGYSYSIKITLCNFLKACGSATKVITVAETVAPVPVVTIAGQSVRTVYRTDALSVLADAYTQSCSGAKSSAGLQYSWVMTQLLPGASAYTNATLRSTSQNPTVFKLPFYSLTVGAVYTVTVSALSMLSGQRSSAVVQLKVLQSDLVAVLKGGSTRCAMVGEVVTLDASGSYDKDYPQQPLATATMSYAWQCITVSPVLSAACAVTLLEVSPGHSPVVNVTSTYIALNTTTVVSVTVSDASRSSTAQVRIVILQAPSPRLFISAVGPTDNVNTGKPFTLLGSMYLLAPCTAAWSVDDPTIALTKAARTPVQQWTVPGPSAAAVPFNLVIKSDALPQRATLQFTLSCGSTVVSTAVTTNGAPLPGSFSVKPEFGVELSTVFIFAAAQWTDPDLPLTYQFGFQSAVSLSNLVIVSRSEQSYATSSLPAGDVSRASAVDCSLRIFDSLGAFADRATVVLVATQDNADQSSQLVLELLKSSADSVQGMKTALAVGSSVVNAVNCTAAPNCGPLSRHPCRMTSGQCGTCLDGYAGDAGDRNSQCVALTAPPAQLATTKDCAYNCTGHGQCIYVSKTTGAPVTTCTLADTDCDATCACTDHYSGEFCEIDSVTLRRRREVRSNLILSLSNLTVQEDINTESVAAWSANLYALSIRPHEVSQVDAAVLADIANTTLHHAIALGVDSYADMLGVLQATDAVASLLRYNYNPNDYRDADFNTSRSYVNNTAARFLPVVSAFGDMVSKLMVLGENETTLSYDNFRMSVALAAGKRIEEQHSVPAGELTRFTAASSVALQTVTSQAVPAVAIKVMSTHPRSYTEDTADYVSSPVRLQVQALGSLQSSAAEYLSSIEFTFQHNEPQYQYVHYEGHNFTTTCTARNASQTFAYHCTDSEHVIHHNCSQGAGVHVSYCPKPVAACAMLALETAEITTPSACVVVNSTATYTTCRCTVSSDLRRSLATTEQQILDTTGATDMLTTTVYIASDFADTFSAAGALNNATLSSVLVVVLLLGSVWATGLGILVMEWTWYKWSPEKVKAAKEREGVQSILTYIDSVIPKVFERGTSSVRRLVSEVTQHHVLFQLATADTPAERWFLMMQALTDLTVLFFLTAAFFDISQPGDDGTCPHYTAAGSCLKRVCPFDYSQTYCKWVEVGVSASEGQCMYNNQGMSTTALFFLTVLTTVISSIVSIPIEYQFATLKAPTALSLEGSKVSAVVDTVVSGARRVSNAGLAFFEPARVAPATAPKPPTERGKSFLFKPAGDGVVANREIPASIAEISAAARGSLAVIGRNASTLALGAEGASRALRSRSTRIARRSTAGQGGSALVKPGSAALRLAEPTMFTMAGAHDNDDGAVLLMQDVVHQRLLMNSAAKETQEFDAQWGVLYDGADTYTVRSEVAECIQTAVKESSKEASRLNETLSNYSLQHAGLEMLHLFMLDLLGRNTIAAKIFREKFGEEFGHSRVVVRWQKFFAAAALLGLNAFFIYFVMIKGVQKGRNWQEQYVACCLVQVGVDILLFETVECAWLNFLVPQYVHEEVASAAEKLRSLTQRVAGLRTDIEEASPDKEATKFFLNAPAHLFVSTKLAKKKPQLLESMIVSSYRHHLPGEICKTWPHCSEREETQRPTQVRTWLSLLRWVLRGLTLSLQLFVGVPFAYQKVGLRFAQPVVFSGLALVIYTIFTSVAGLVVIGVCVLAAVAYAVRGWWIIDRLGMAAIAPYTDNEVPTFMEDASSSDSSVEVSSEDDSSAEEHLGIEFWNAGFDTGSESESSLEMSAESDDVAERSSNMEDGEDQSEYVESEHSFPGYSDSAEEYSGTVGSDGEGLELHHELQEPGSGSGTDDAPSSEHVSWGEASGSEEPHSGSDHASHSELSSASMHHELRQDSYGAEGGPPSEMSECGSEEVPHSDIHSDGSLEEDSW